MVALTFYLAVIFALVWVTVDDILNGQQPVPNHWFDWIMFVAAFTVWPIMFVVWVVDTAIPSYRNRNRQ